MVAVIFPGQGSQRPGMGQALVEQFPIARKVFDDVTEATGVNTLTLCFDTDEDTLRRTDNAQLALFVCGVAAYRVLRDQVPSLPVRAFAGHSVGEYAALVASGALDLADGARLIMRRGDLMNRSGNLRAGTMAAVLGMSREDLEAVCTEASNSTQVVIANDNCPGQLVISGDVDAVQRATALASERGAKRVLPLNVAGAFHSPLMKESSEAMGVALQDVSFSHGEAPVYANVTAGPVATPEAWPGLLEAQLASPVRWTESVQAMIQDGIQLFVECGSGEVLCGLVKRTDKSARALPVIDPATLETAKQAITEEVVA